jgi:hypothetical protein
MTKSTISGFTTSDIASGEARVYNYYTGALIMSVDVEGLQMDAAADVVFRAMRENLDPEATCSVEIDQAPYGREV